MNIQYQGEHLLPGNIGHALVIVALCTTVLSFSSFLFATLRRDRLEETGWRRIGIISWFVHTASIIGTIGLLYYLIFSHYYEYDYVRRTSTEGMELQYMISSMWAQQQGSFLLWLFWHSIVGCILLVAVRRRWSSPAMAVFSLVQFVITSMILGIYMDRWVIILILVVTLSLPLWLLLKGVGQKGWTSLVPLLNLTSALRAVRRNPRSASVARPEGESQESIPAAYRAPTWLLITLALPINLLVFAWLPMNIEEIGQFLSGAVKLGVSPFELSRQTFSMSPVFLHPDYLTMISGQGMNPLLENYWMVIHPPTLFLGFASTLVPFSLTIAALWLRDYANWWKPALPFTVFSVMILGTGIMMGGLWAYESLSFGGFWAWDPVENASFVPWLTLLAGLHTLIIFKSTKRALRLTMIFFIATVFLVLYSTFLTRSGILGDTSVHAFTDLGMMGQLLILILAIIVPALVMLAVAWPHLPKVPQEEKFLSREFWMSIGSLVLLLSALHITISTSVPILNYAWVPLAPVLNDLLAWFGQARFIEEGPIAINDPLSYYNSVQVWIGVLIAILSGFALFLKFKHSPLKGLTQLGLHVVTASVATVLIALFIQVSEASHYVLLFSGLFSVSANGHYFIKTLRKKFKLSGAAISHLGFGAIMIGLVVALANSSIISKNVSRLAYVKDETPEEQEFNRNNVLMARGEPVNMGNYRVTYLGREQDSIDFHYRVLYERFDKETGELKETFILRPHLMNHPQQGLVPNPSTRHYLTKDVFTLVSQIPPSSLERPTDELVPGEYFLNAGSRRDSFFTSSGLVRFKGFVPVSDGQNFSVTANLELQDIDTAYELKPVYSIVGDSVFIQEAHLPEKNFTIALSRIEPDKGFTFRTLEVVDWIIMKAIVFPFINLLWLGIVLTVVGMVIILRKRILEYRRSLRKPAP
jgi:cytochrome c-type biogenesis protein CcmF